MRIICCWIQNSNGGYFLFVATVAAAEGDDFIGAGAAVLFEVGEDSFEWRPLDSRRSLARY